MADVGSCPNCYDGRHDKCFGRVDCTCCQPPFDHQANKAEAWKVIPNGA